jgi:hypothetical protein
MTPKVTATLSQALEGAASARRREFRLLSGLI